MTKTSTTPTVDALPGRTRILRAKPEDLCAEATLPIRRVTRPLSYLFDEDGRMLFILNGNSTGVTIPAPLASPLSSPSRRRLREIGNSMGPDFKFRILTYGKNTLKLPDAADPVWKAALAKALHGENS